MRFILRAICFVRGHRWSIVAVNERKHFNLVHLHPMAGTHAVCRRCAKVWDDLGGPWLRLVGESGLPTARTARQ